MSDGEGEREREREREMEFLRAWLVQRRTREEDRLMQPNDVAAVGGMKMDGFGFSLEFSFFGALLVFI